MGSGLFVMPSMLGALGIIAGRKRTKLLMSIGCGRMPGPHALSATPSLVEPLAKCESLHQSMFFAPMSCAYVRCNVPVSSPLEADAGVLERDAASNLGWTLEYAMSHTALAHMQEMRLAAVECVLDLRFDEAKLRVWRAPGPRVRWRPGIYWALAVEDRERLLLVITLLRIHQVPRELWHLIVCSAMS